MSTALLLKLELKYFALERHSIHFGTQVTMYVCGTINDIFLTWRNRVKRMRHFKIPVKSLSNCNTAWWLVRETALL